MKQILHRLIRIDYLIRIKSIGSPKALAEKIGMSERSMYEYIKILKAFGAPVAYNRTKQSYYYLTEGSFTIAFIDTP